MKILIKEITENGSSLLVYLMTKTNQAVACEITSKDNLDDTIESFMNKNDKLSFSNPQYLKYNE